MNPATLLLGVPLARFLVTLLLLLKGAPEGPLPVLRHFLVAALVLLGPGLALHRFFDRRLPRSIVLRLLAVLFTSLSTSGLVVWQCYFFALYTPLAAKLLLAASALALAYGLFTLDFRRLVRAVSGRWKALPAGDKAGLLLLALFLELLFESAAGLPYTEWDAVVSWDKWAVDMARRDGLGGYLAGAYPQFHPAIGSLFYKVAPAIREPLPAEQLLLHGFQAVYPLLLALSLWWTGRRFRFPGLLAFFLFAALPEVNASLANGYADIPLVAVLGATFVLTEALASGLDRPAGGRPAAGTALLFSVFFFASLFTKGTGLLWVLFFAGRLLLLHGRRARAATLAALAAAIALSYPYLAIQRWLTAHPESSETSPFLHAFPVVYAHVSLFTPDLRHLAGLFERAFAYRRPLLSYPLPMIAILASGTAAAALLVKRARPFALLALAGLAFWFYTASYDLRNAFPALCVAACAVAALGPATLPRPRQAAGRTATRLLAALLLLAITLPALADGLLPLFARGGWRYRLPRAYTDPPARRHMAFRPEGDLRNILFEAPYGLRAPHLVAGTHLYRLLAPKGVYAIQRNAYLRPMPHDLVVQNRGMKDPPAGFAPVATIRRAPGYTTLWSYGLGAAPVLFRVTTADGKTGEPTETATIPPGASVTVEVVQAPPPDEGPGASPSREIRDGILECKTSPLGDGSVSLLGEDRARDPFRDYVAPWRDAGGETTRLLYWMKGEGPAVPRLSVRAGPAPLTLRSISLSRARYERPGPS